MNEKTKATPDVAIRVLEELRRRTSGQQRVALVELHNAATGGAVVATVSDGVEWLLDWLAGPALAQALAWIAGGGEDEIRGFRLLILRHNFGGVASFEQLGRGNSPEAPTWRARAKAWTAATEAALGDPRSRAALARFVDAMKAVDPAFVGLLAHRRRQSGDAG
jgi:hypothetical protein